MDLSPFQAVTIALIAVLSVIGIALFGRTVGHLYRLFREGRPDHTRRGKAKERAYSLFSESVGHARLGRWPLVGAMHWFIFFGFAVLSLTLINAYGQLFNPEFVLPIIGHWRVWEWTSELFAWFTLIAILVLMFIRQKSHPRRAADDGKRSRFFGSTFWQAYYVEGTILAVAICIIFLRGHEWALAAARADAGEGPAPTWVHWPLSGWMGHIIQNESVTTMENAVVVIAGIKIIVSMAWFITIAMQPSMGVAWHRFLAFFNVWFKRYPGHVAGRGLVPSLGALHPIMLDGDPMDFEKIDELEDHSVFGVGAIENFTWKNLLDFSTCTECGRCQSQCPAWNTDKPLSPKLLILSLRDHHHAKGLWTLASDEERALAGTPGAHLDAEAKAEAERPLVGPAVPGTRSAGGKANSSADHRDVLGDLEAGLGGVIDPDMLWSCTTCGACVQQCPVDIEHVDHIIDMRRYQVLVENAFPSELSGLYKKLEKNSNPWGVSPRLRMDWAKNLPFDVPQVGADVEDLSEVEYLFWVGCAGAYEDRQKKTTRAIAELLHMADVSFAVLGDGEACTGDPARRSGNEFLFHQLAMQNVEMLNEAKAQKIVVSCAHCFNTLKNEYPQLGGHYEVVHHTQLLNRLVRERRLLPVAAPDGNGSANGAAAATKVTYHDPCYIGRHNGVYAPPRELIGSLPGVTLTEMPRHELWSFCCGAGGARMWMEEKIGSRINVNRTAEAVATGATQIAVACPFCRVMLSDGLNAEKQDGHASDEVEVIDVAQMLLAAVKRTDAQPAPA